MLTETKILTDNDGKILELSHKSMPHFCCHFLIETFGRNLFPKQVLKPTSTTTLALTLVREMRNRGINKIEAHHESNDGKTTYNCALATTGGRHCKNVRNTTSTGTFP